MRINGTTVKKVLGAAWSVLSFCVLTASAFHANTRQYDVGNSWTVDYGDAVGYGEAVEAISNDNSMFSHHKREAICKLKRNGSHEFYKAIIAIASDDSMFSHHKLEMIERLSSDN